MEKGFADPDRHASVRALVTRSAGGATASSALGLTPEEEQRLVERARGGDSRALARLVTLLSVPVLRYGRGFCGNLPDAEDVTQVVLAALVRKLADFRGQAALTTWAYVVARNACRRRLRRERRAGVRLESLEATRGRHPAYRLPDAEGDPGRAVERRELGRILDRAMAALPPAQREVLLLRDVEGLRARDVARVLGLDVAAVKSRLHRARAALRVVLAPYMGVADGRREPGCPDTATILSRALEGEITPGACTRLEAHVARCPDCRTTCEGLRRALDLCRRARTQPLPATVTRAVRESVGRRLGRSEIEERGRRRSGRHA